MIKSYADFKLESAQLILGNDLADFPVDPQRGEFALVNGVLYIYSEIESTLTWHPLTNKSLHYVHTQGTPSTTWNVAHGLHSTDLVFGIYDEENDLQLADIDIVDEDNLIVNLTEPTQGRGVFFAASLGYAALVQNPLDGNFDIIGDIEPEAASTYSIGTSATPLDTVYADSFDGTATSAQYADLAEKYTCNENLKPGTVVKVCSGEYEVEQNENELALNIVGVVSENPAFLMNKLSEGLPIALTGKVNVRVVGSVKKGDILVPTTNGCARPCNDLSEVQYKIGYSLENNDIEEERLVMCIVK